MSEERQPPTILESDVPANGSAWAALLAASSPWRNSRARRLRLSHGLFVVETPRCVLQYSSFLRLDPVRNPRRDTAREFHHGLLVADHPSWRVCLKIRATAWLMAGRPRFRLRQLGLTSGFMRLPGKSARPPWTEFTCGYPCVNIS